MSSTAKAALQRWIAATEREWFKTHPADRRDLLDEMRRELTQLKTKPASAYDHHHAAALTSPLSPAA